MVAKTQKHKERVSPVCPDCGLKQIYVRIDGTRRCPKCGYDSKKEVE